MDQSETMASHIFHYYIGRVCNMKALALCLRKKVASTSQAKVRKFDHFKASVNSQFLVDQTESLTLHIFSYYILRMYNMKTLALFLHYRSGLHKVVPIEGDRQTDGRTSWSLHPSVSRRITTYFVTMSNLTVSRSGIDLYMV